MALRISLILEGSDNRSNSKPAQVYESYSPLSTASAFSHRTGTASKLDRILTCQEFISITTRPRRSLLRLPRRWSPRSRQLSGILRACIAMANGLKQRSTMLGTLSRDSSAPTLPASSSPPGGLNRTTSRCAVRPRGFPPPALPAPAGRGRPSHTFHVTHLDK